MWNLCDGREPKVDFLVICSSVPPLNFPTYVFLDSAYIARMLSSVHSKSFIALLRLVQLDCLHDVHGRL